MTIEALGRCSTLGVLWIACGIAACGDSGRSPATDPRPAPSRPAPERSPGQGDSQPARPVLVPSEDRTDDAALRERLLAVLRREHAELTAAVSRPGFGWNDFVEYARRHGSSVPARVDDETQQMMLDVMRDHAALVMLDPPDVRRILVRDDRALLIERRGTDDSTLLLSRLKRDASGAWVLLGNISRTHEFVGADPRSRLEASLRDDPDLRSVYSEKELAPLLGGMTRARLVGGADRPVVLRINGHRVHVNRIPATLELYDERVAADSPHGRDPVFADRFCLRAGANRLTIEAGPGDFSATLKVEQLKRPVITIEIPQAGGRASGSFDLDVAHPVPVVITAR